MGARPAIVTTLLNPGSVLEFFIEYHLSIGFEHIFLFFDNPNDPAISRARLYPSVSVIPNDALLHVAWRSTYPYVFAFDKLDQHIRRQICNVDLAIQIAIEMGFNWLLHIDIDELFYSPKQSAQQHFDNLDSQNINNIVYLNYEAIPEKFDIDNYFKEVTLFKKNPRNQEIQRFNSSQRDLINKFFSSYGYFLSYRCGKSAVRVSPYVHPANLNLDIVEKGGVHRFFDENKPDDHLFVAGDDHVILHYPSCGFERFWKKYKKFRYKPKSFYRDAREIALKNDDISAKKLYENSIMINNKSITDYLIESGVLLRISVPSHLMHCLPVAEGFVFDDGAQ